MVEIPRVDEPSQGPEDRPPHLTPTERLLLATLQKEAGRVLTRRELVSMVLKDSQASARTVDVHIRALRKKLGPAAHILTVRGQGYAWEPDPPPPDQGDAGDAPPDPNGAGGS
jgi:DNA-binding response OmpR family regulator